MIQSTMLSTGKKDLLCCNRHVCTLTHPHTPAYKNALLEQKDGRVQKQRNSPMGRYNRLCPH